MLDFIFVKLHIHFLLLQSKRLAFLMFYSVQFEKLYVNLFSFFAIMYKNRNFFSTNLFIFFNKHKQRIRQCLFDNYQIDRIHIKRK